MKGVPAGSRPARIGTHSNFGSPPASAAIQQTRPRPKAERKQSAAAAPDLVLRALADPHRRQIQRLVNHSELPAGQIAAAFTLTQQAVSQHIGVLKQAGLLTERRDGTRRLYALHHESLEPVRDLLSKFWPDALSRLKKAVETAHPRPKR